MRRTVASPPTDRPASTLVEGEPDLPVEALPQPQRGHWFNFRRQQNPMGEGQIQTWRTRLIKVAADVVSTLRVVIRLSGSWPYLEQYLRISEQILGIKTPSTE